MDLVILNRGQTTRITPEPAPLSPSFRIIPARKRLSHEVRFRAQQVHIYGGCSVESGFEPGTILPEAEALPPGHRGS
ncbi:hypothetical protein AVEN_226349-1 [Araneus ventricosus]|uniref:Uncharacterized protein n=1 Tax=Araneus ventricosus TaxID=182803 RepID=A0A4Y2IN05_ARAVE|nr:hypothetical protein AVEN_226349-1 [Araneus ventricosus]